MKGLDALLSAWKNFQDKNDKGALEKQTKVASPQKLLKDRKKVKKQKKHDGKKESKKEKGFTSQWWASGAVKEELSTTGREAGLEGEWDHIIGKARAESTQNSYVSTLTEACRRCPVKLKRKLLPIESPSDLLEKVMVITMMIWAKNPKGHSWAYLNTLKHALAFHLKFEGREEWVAYPRIALVFDARRREGNNDRKEKFVVQPEHFSEAEKNAESSWEKLKLIKHAKWSPCSTWIAAWGAIRDLAIIKMGFFTVRRCKELAELAVSDIAWSSEDQGYHITIRKSKTDQIGEGHHVFWPKKLGTIALDRYLQVRERILKSCTEGLWETSQGLFVNISGARLGLQMSVETLRQMLKKKVALPPYSAHSGVPSLRRGGAEWWLNCPDSDKSRMIARSLGGWKSFTMLDEVYRNSKPPPALISSIVEKRDNQGLLTEPSGSVTESKKMVAPVTISPNPKPPSRPLCPDGTLIGKAPVDVEVENAKRKIFHDLEKIDDESVPGLLLEAIASRIIKLNKSRKNAISWENIKKYKCYKALKREILECIKKEQESKESKTDSTQKTSM